MLKTIKIGNKEYSKIHELTYELNNLLPSLDLLSGLVNMNDKISEREIIVHVDKIKNLLEGINFLANQLENEFIYRGDMLRELIDKVHEVYMKNKFSFNLHPSEN